MFNCRSVQSVTFEELKLFFFSYIPSYYCSAVFPHASFLSGSLNVWTSLCCWEEAIGGIKIPAIAQFPSQGMECVSLGATNHGAATGAVTVTSHTGNFKNGYTFMNLFVEMYLFNAVFTYTVSIKTRASSYWISEEWMLNCSMNMSSPSTQLWTVMILLSMYFYWWPTGGLLFLWCVWNTARMVSPPDNLMVKWYVCTCADYCGCSCIFVHVYINVEKWINLSIKTQCASLQKKRKFCCN